MKFLRLMAISLLSLISLIVILSCESTDDVVSTHSSQLGMAWQGISFGDYNPAKSCEDQVCACFTSLKITVSKVMLQRIDIDGTEPFDLYGGKSYTFDAKVNANGNFFTIPDLPMTLDPGIYQLQSIMIDKVQASPDISGNGNLGLNDAPPTSAYLNLQLGAYCSDTLNLQEGWSKILRAEFSCTESIRYNKSTKRFTFFPIIYIQEPHCVY
ncbi:MAG: hypothetical protein AB1756_01690 [Acidobacteriota bacterium]